MAAAADHTKYALLFHSLLRQRVYAPPSGYEAWFVSLAHTESDIDNTLTAAERAVGG